MIVSIDDFFTLRKSLPVVDVRSEGEFSEGHIHEATNIPLLNNAERAAVGTDYKQKGQAEAIKTGFRLVGPRLNALVTETERVAAQKKEIVVHCWRGGMRSAHFCQFVQMAGIKTHQLGGGYKSYRHAALESFRRPFHFMIVGGCTGSGKSEILRELAKAGEQIIDFEKLASHKGSAFGGLMMPPQPTTEQFQNDLFEEILKLDISKRIWIEDESLSIGRIFIPQDMWTTMEKSPVIEIQVDKDIRIQRLVKEYGNANPEQFLESMQKITKRLGGQHFKAAKDKLLLGDMPAVMDILLTYYDKAYGNGLNRKKDRTLATLEWDGENSNLIVNELRKIPLLNHIYH